MTTFTMQDLTINNLPTTPEEDEAMQALSEKQHAPEPQPTCGQPVHTPSQVNPEALIEHMVAQSSINLRLLLTTIISQPKAQPEGAQESLQETVALVLQQSDWFKSMVRETIVDEVSLEDVVKDIVKDEVESAVDTYFRNEFDPTYHFDFGDAVSSEVSDQLDDVVRDRLDEVVQEQLEEVVAEKLKSIRVVFD